MNILDKFNVDVTSTITINVNMVWTKGWTYLQRQTDGHTNEKYDAHRIYVVILIY